MSNEIDHPSHYNGGKLEVIDIIEDQNFPQHVAFHLGNAIKYICRAGKKTLDPLPDLRKAAWYLARAISHLESKQKEQ